MTTFDTIQALAEPVLRLALDAGHEILRVSSSDDLQVERKSDWSPLTLADRRAHDIIDSGLRALTPDIPILSEEGKDVPFAERSGWDELWLVDPLDGTKEFIKGNGEFTVNIGLIQDSEPVFGAVYAPACGVAYAGICPPAADVQPAGAQSGRETTAGEATGTGTTVPVFPGPGAYRFVIDSSDRAAGDLAERAEPISGATPAPDRLRVIASRSHMGRRTRAFVKNARTEFESIELVHVGSSLKLCMIAEGSAHIYPRSWPTMEWDTAAGHALVRAAGGEVWSAPRDGRGGIVNWFAETPVDRAESDAGHGPRAISPVRYNREDLRNKAFVARGW